MVEVFKTNVQEVDEAEKIRKKLLAQFPVHRINFDLQDCDKILRVEGENISPGNIIKLVSASGYQAEVLI